MKTAQFIPLIIITIFILIILTIISLLLMNNLIILIGNSMYPTINSTSVIKCVPQDNYSLNDIVCYYNGWQRVCHRIVGMFNYSWIMKGDNNNYTDYKMYTNKEISCKVVKIYK